jgi:hypothetical protein
MEVDIEMVVD